MIKIIILIINIIIQISRYFLKLSDYDSTIISILNSICAFNIIFVKIFQWTWVKNNSNSRYMTGKILEYLHMYTNNTPYGPEDIDYKSLVNIFITSNKLGHRIELIHLEPSNSGSVSLIFKGKLNGNNVVIKILRKNIISEINKGINLLIWIEKIIQYIPWIKKFDTNNIFSNNKTNIINQTNFINETENIKLFGEKFLNNKNVIIPNVYQEYTVANPDVILMDWIDGRNLSELTESELDDYFIYFFRFLFNSIFVKNIFHSDLHQGNVLFGKKISSSGKEKLAIGVIDFGMIIKIDVREVNFSYLWFESVYNDKFINLVDFIKDEKNKINIFEKSEQINKCAEYLIQMHNDKKIFNSFTFENFSQDIYLFLKILNHHNCILLPKCHYYVLSLIPIFSIIVKLGPNLDKRKIIKEELARMTNSHLLD